MSTSLNRDDIVTGLRELIAELQAANQVVGIRVVGGAALALRYFDRGTTQDLDSLQVHPGNDAEVAAAASRVAGMHGWDPTWLNFSVEETGRCQPSVAQSQVGDKKPGAIKRVPPEATARSSPC